VFSQSVLLCVWTSKALDEACGELIHDSSDAAFPKNACRQPALGAQHISQLLPVQQQQQKQSGQVQLSTWEGQQSTTGVPSMYELKHQMDHVKKLHPGDLAGAAGNGSLQRCSSPSSKTAQQAPMATGTNCKNQRCLHSSRPNSTALCGISAAQRSSTLPAVMMRPSTASPQQSMSYIPSSLQSSSRKPQVSSTLL